MFRSDGLRDAIHIAVASVHGIDFLLTWNCRHIANAAIMRDLHDILTSFDFDLHAGRTFWRMIDMARTPEATTTDEVILESRRIKAALAEAMDFDIDRILEDAKEKQYQAGRIVLSPPVREVASRRE